jgi:hypothetical protein
MGSLVVVVDRYLAKRRRAGLCGRWAVIDCALPQRYDQQE